MKPQKFSYRVMLMSHCGFDCVIKNTIHGIEISDVVSVGGFFVGDSANVISCVLSNYIPMYSNITTSTRLGRKKLGQYISNEIRKEEERIEKLKLVREMCRKEKSQIIK